MGFVLHCILALFNLHVVLYAHGNACSETLFVCERHSGEINCGDGVISICTAVYGRTHPTTCAAASKTDCVLDVSSDIESCNGQKQCSVEASNSLYGDPCSGTEKYLEITYSCQGDMTLTTTQAQTKQSTTTKPPTTPQQQTTTQPQTSPQQQTTTQPSTPQPQQTTTQPSTTTQQHTTIRTTEAPTTTLSTTTPQTMTVQTLTTLPSRPIKRSRTYRLLANNAALSASYSSNRATSFIRCSQICLGDASCKSFTYIGGTGVCLLGQHSALEVHQGAKTYTS